MLLLIRKHEDQCLMHRVSLNLKITLLVEENRFLDSGGPVSIIPHTGVLLVLRFVIHFC